MTALAVEPCALDRSTPPQGQSSGIWLCCPLFLPAPSPAATSVPSRCHSSAVKESNEPIRFVTFIHRHLLLCAAILCVTVHTLDVSTWEVCKSFSSCATGHHIHPRHRPRFGHSSHCGRHHHHHRRRKDHQVLSGGSLFTSEPDRLPGLKRTVEASRRQHTTHAMGGGNCAVFDLWDGCASACQAKLVMF